MDDVTYDTCRDQFNKPLLTTCELLVALGDTEERPNEAVQKTSEVYATKSLEQWTPNYKPNDEGCENSLINCFCGKCDGGKDKGEK